MVRSTVQTPGRRQRSEHKQAVILDAAERLFVGDGYELTSVDAIAAEAGVSKRTVYDHFTDKRTLFHSVLMRVRKALITTVHAAIEQELTPGRDLRDALTAFAMRVATEAFPSPHYVTFRQLLSTQGSSAPRLPQDMREEPEGMLVERFAALAAAGEIHTDDAYRAMKHFTALTILLALEALRDDPAGSAKEIPMIITTGVDAFLRAYQRS